MAEDHLRRLLDYLLEEAKHFRPQYVVNGKMAIPNSAPDFETGERNRSTRY